MLVTMMLANHVEVHNGLFYINGGGWTVCGPDPITCGLAIHIEVPWDQTNMAHPWKLELVDADGQPVMIENGESGEEQPLVAIEDSFEIGRPPGVRPGNPLDVSLSFGFITLPIPPGGRYRFQLSIDGEQAGFAAFTVRDAPPAPAA